VTIVLGMRLMGAMLISSLVIFPALTAMRLLRSFRGVVLCVTVEFYAILSLLASMLMIINISK